VREEEAAPAISRRTRKPSFCESCRIGACRASARFTVARSTSESSPRRIKISRRPSAPDGSARNLYYRLGVLPIRIPPLRERREDIPELCRYFVRHFAAKLRKPVDHVSLDALKRLESYDWPGNIRELQNVIERAVILAPGGVVDAQAIQIASASQARRSQSPPDEVVTLAEAERRAIRAALQALKPTTLHAKMKKLGVHRLLARPAVKPGG
jgi:transcriptional regulator with AAA-type ATPase domain